eukprot:CAMPEP_0113577688 /NCGR_PEP_ID=MMETSP0015_2-20120614/29023_1 /TAXON_ID=2838 /ORGANISM="Odontella" /LENGTH=57 /DNA_ID=CAMNT_0000481327 /DNA_START=127 /DNA_END=301 /DNA_ORIENTATION=- /assembly_acc=CAM_ASM_000160
MPMIASSLFGSYEGKEANPPAGLEIHGAWAEEGALAPVLRVAGGGYTVHMPAGRDIP